jgi:hypothetical protein
MVMTSVWGRNPDDYDDRLRRWDAREEITIAMFGDTAVVDVDQDAVPEPVPKDGYDQQFDGNNDPEGMDQDAVPELDQQDGDDEDALDDAAWGDITSFKQLVMALRRVLYATGRSKDNSNSIVLRPAG